MTLKRVSAWDELCGLYAIAAPEDQAVDKDAFGGVDAVNNLDEAKMEW